MLWILAGLGLLGLLSYFFVILKTSDRDASSDYEIDIDGDQE